MVQRHLASQQRRPTQSLQCLHSVLLVQLMSSGEPPCLALKHSPASSPEETRIITEAAATAGQRRNLG